MEWQCLCLWLDKGANEVQGVSRDGSVVSDGPSGISSTPQSSLPVKHMKCLHSNFIPAEIWGNKTPWWTCPGNTAWIVAGGMAGVRVETARTDKPPKTAWSERSYPKTEWNEETNNDNTCLQQAPVGLSSNQVMRLSPPCPVRAGCTHTSMPLWDQKWWDLGCLETCRCFWTPCKCSALWFICWPADIDPECEIHWLLAN